MKTHLRTWIVPFAALLLLIGCDAGPSSNDVKGDENFLGMNVPADFEFETTREITLNITKGGLAGNVVLDIYADQPNRKGSKLRQGKLSGSGSITMELTIPSHKEELWVSASSEGSLSTFKRVQIGSASSYSVDMSSQHASGAAPMSTPQGCTSGCTQTIGGSSSGNLLVETGQVVCILEGASHSGGITFQGNGQAELRICGDANISFVNNNGNPVPVVEIGENGSLETGNFNINNPNAVLTNYGNIKFNNNFSYSYSFFNHGMVDAGGINLNSGAVFTNTNTVEMTDDLNVNSQAVFTNDNYVELIGSGSHVHINGQGTLINNCTMIVGGHFNQNAKLENNGYIQIANQLTFNSGSGSTPNVLGAGSLMEAPKMIVNTPLTASGSGYARFDIEEEVRINGGASATGLLDVCLAPGGNWIDAGGSIDEATYRLCDAFIPETSCNPGAGDQDLPDESFDNPFPGENKFGTLAFEDLWPSFGDYDMNDLVVDYNINEITNASDDVTDIEFTIVIRAIGAYIESGFAFELPVPSSAVQTVTGSQFYSSAISLNGNGTEAGQDNAVIIITDNATKNIGRYVNTVNPANHVPEDTVSVQVSFSTPVAKSTLGSAPYNPFTFRVENRGNEVHLPGKPPTSLADASLFGTKDDTTDPASERYYKSSSNLNWAIHVPESIPYPLEKIDITQAYLNFKDWAESGGISFPGWYLDEPGNRDDSKLYIKN